MKEELKKELEEFSPFLSKMQEKSDGRTVPNHFFNNMKIDVMNKVKSEIQTSNEPVKSNNQKSQISLFFAKIFQPRMAFQIASVMALIGVGFFLYEKNNTKVVTEECLTMACISDEELERYINENSYEFEGDLMLNTKESNEIEKSKSLNTSDEDLDEIIEEMIENGELSKDEIL